MAATETISTQQELTEQPWYLSFNKTEAPQEAKKEDPETAGSLFAKNRAVSSLRLSGKSNNFLIVLARKIVKLIKRLLEYILPLKKVDSAKVASLSERCRSIGRESLLFGGGGMLSSLPLATYIEAVQPLLSRENGFSPEVKECLNLFRKQTVVLDQTGRAFTEKFGKEKAKELAKEVHSLKPGQMRLILADGNRGVFFLFKREADGKMRFTIISRDSATMAALTGVAKVDLLEKEKVVTGVSYCAEPALIDQGWLEALFSYSAVRATLAGHQFTPEHLCELTSHLEPCREKIEVDRKELLASKTDQLGAKANHVVKTFWTALDHLQAVSKEKSLAEARGPAAQLMRLRCDLGLLFKMANEYEDRLGKQGKEFAAVDSMLRTVSQKALRLQNRGILTKEQLSEVAQELIVVHKKLAEAKEEELPSLGRMKMSMNSRKMEKSLLAQVAPPADLPVVEKPTLDPSQVRSPASRSAAFSRVDLRSEPIPTSIERPSSQEEFKRKVEELAKSRSLYQLVEYFSSRSLPDEWKEVSSNEAMKLMEKISAFSAQLVEQLKGRPHLPIDACIAISHLSAVLLQLNSRCTPLNATLQDYTIRSWTINGSMLEGWRPDPHLLLRDHRSDYIPRPEEKKITCFDREQLRDKVRYLLRQRELILSLVGGEGPSDDELLDHAIAKQKWDNEVEEARAAERSQPYMWQLYARKPSLDESKPTSYEFVSKQKWSWMLPLTPDLAVAAKQKLGVIGRGRSIFDDDSGGANMDGSEAAQHDPWNALDHLREDLERSLGHNSALEEFALPDLLPPSPQTESDLSTEQMRQLLLLARKEGLQTEVWAFLQSNPSLLAKPTVRNYLMMAFFHRNNFSFSPHLHLFWKNLPADLATKIAEYREKALEKKQTRYLPHLLFYLELSHRLEKCYERYNEIHSEGEMLGTLSFFQQKRELLQEVVKSVQNHGTASSHLHHALTLQLQFLLSQNSLTDQEIADALTSHTLFKHSTGNLLEIDQREVWWIELRFQELWRKLKADEGQKNIGLYAPILDDICARKMLPLDSSDWTGSWEEGLPIFRNKQYEINLETGSIRYLSGLELISLPAEVVAQPMFRRHFADLVDVTHLQATAQQTKEGLKVYSFGTSQGPCRIEEQPDGSSRYYRSLPAIAEGKQLQAIQLPEPEDPAGELMKKVQEMLTGKGPGSRRGSKGKKKDFLAQLPELIKVMAALLGVIDLSPSISLPSILLDAKSYVDPNDPHQAYSVDEKGNLLFKVRLKTTGKKIEIESLLDCREESSGKPCQLISAAGVDHPMLKHLARFEHPSKMLLWLEKGKIVRVELPRYQGLSFKVVGDQLQAIDARYQGYVVDFSATAAEQRVPFSLVLKHPTDAALPKKLLVPKSDQIGIGMQLHRDHQGLAAWIALVGKVISFILHRLLPPLPFRFQAQIDINCKSCSYDSFDLLPYTGQLEPVEEESRLPAYLSLAQQAFMTGQYELACELLSRMPLERSDLTKENLKQIQAFFLATRSRKSSASAMLGQLDYAGAVAAAKLRFVSRVKHLLKGEGGKLGILRGQIPAAETALFLAYLSEKGRVPPSLQLSDLEFARLSRLVNRIKPDLYKQRLAPYFSASPSIYPQIHPFAGDRKATPPAASQEALSPVGDEELNELLRRHVKTIDQPLTGRLIAGRREWDPFQQKSEVSRFFFPLYRTAKEAQTASMEFQRLKWGLKMRLFSSEGDGTGARAREERRLCTLLWTIVAAREEGLVQGQQLPSLFPIRSQPDRFGEVNVNLGDVSQTRALLEGLIKVATPHLQRFQPKLPPLSQVAQQSATTAGEDQLEARYQELKRAARMRRRFTIEQLEAAVALGEEVSPMQLRRPLHYLEDGPSILFSAEEEQKLRDRYFKRRELDPSDLTLEAIPGEPESAAVIEQLMQSLRSHRKKENRTRYNIKKRSDWKQLGKELHTRLKKLEKEERRVGSEIDRLVQGFTDPRAQIELCAGARKPVPYSQLLLALIDDDFEKFVREKRLPEGVDIAQLKELCFQYGDLLIQKSLVKECHQEAERLGASTEEDEESAEIATTALVRRLFSVRHYDAKLNRDLFIFEAFHFHHPFREMAAGGNQVDLLREVLSDPNNRHSVIQAGTGSGKTTVINLLTGYLAADGKKVVVQKVLSPLLGQTQRLLRSFAARFGIPVYQLLFDLKGIRVRRDLEEQYTAVGEDGKRETKKRVVSLFKRIYQELLEVTKDRGIVLTDYRSVPLLKEYSFQLLDELGEDPGNKQLQEHCKWLGKILDFYEGRAVEFDDEGDHPNQPSQIIQIQPKGAEGGKILPHLYGMALELHDLLLQNPKLGLADNLQGEGYASEATRLDAINQVMNEMAKRFATKNGGGISEDEILRYLLWKMSKEEETKFLQKVAASWSNVEERDRLAFCKDEFAILKTTLRRTVGTDCDRGKTGEKTIPCHLGERRESARFGHPLEQLNYTIMTYRYRGPQELEVKKWIQARYADLEKDAVAAQKAFAVRFPGKLLEMWERYSLKDLAAEVLRNPKSLALFLEDRLREQRWGGRVIPLHPHRIAKMNKMRRVVMTATPGCPGVYSSDTTIDRAGLEEREAADLERMIEKRLADPKMMLRYDPAKPIEMLKQQTDNPFRDRIVALVDGLGAYNRCDPREVAQALLELNPKLERVDYHDIEGQECYAGRASAPLDKRGRFYPQRYARGWDDKFIHNGIAMVTLHGKETSSNAGQFVGRMRGEGQRILPACATSEPIQDSKTLLAATFVAEREKRKLVRYRSELQKLDAILWAAADKRVNAIADIRERQKKFAEMVRNSSVLIKQKQEVGSYFEAHKHLSREVSLEEALRICKERLIAQAEALSLGEAVTELRAVTFSKQDLAEMPSSIILPPEGDDDSEIEVEEEQEEEEQVEAEEELEQEVEKEIREATVGFDRYPDRASGLSRRKQVTERGPNWISSRTTDVPGDKEWPTKEPADKHLHPLFDPVIQLGKTYMDLTRDGMHRRKGYDDRTYKANTLLFRMSLDGTISEVVVGDPEDDQHGLPAGLDSSFSQKKKEGAVSSLDDAGGEFEESNKFEMLLDLRTGQITSLGGLFGRYREPMEIRDRMLIGQVLNSRHFKQLVAQISLFINGEVKMASSMRPPRPHEVKEWIEARYAELSTGDHPMVAQREFAQRFPGKQLALWKSYPLDGPNGLLADARQPVASPFFQVGRMMAALSWREKEGFEIPQSGEGITSTELVDLLADPLLRERKLGASQLRKFFEDKVLSCRPDLASSYEGSQAKEFFEALENYERTTMLHT